jgi:hypothetical protein
MLRQALRGWIAPFLVSWFVLSLAETSAVHWCPVPDGPLVPRRIGDVTPALDLGIGGGWTGSGMERRRGMNQQETSDTYLVATRRAFVTL